MNEYTTDNTFANHIDVDDCDFDVDVIDRSGFTSTVLVSPPEPVKETKVDLSEKNSGLKNGKLSVNTKRLVGGRNSPCLCGSGRKLKKCCGKNI